MLRSTTAVLAALAIGLSGCSNVRNEDSGQVIGGVLGGVLGSNVGKGTGRTAAIITGTIAGAMIGGSIGRNMDENDQYRAQRTLESSPTGQTVKWNNPDTGIDYAVTPTNTYTASSGSPCRDYSTDAWIDGRKETVVGTACRQPDGTWRNM